VRSSETDRWLAEPLNKGNNQPWGTNQQVTLLPDKRSKSLALAGPEAIFHICTRSSWEGACRRGKRQYIGEGGAATCLSIWQVRDGVQRAAARHSGGEGILVLEVNTSLLKREQLDFSDKGDALNTATMNQERYPVVHGTVDFDAIVQVHELARFVEYMNNPVPAWSDVMAQSNPITAVKSVHPGEIIGRRTDQYVPPITMRLPQTRSLHPDELMVMLQHARSKKRELEMELCRCCSYDIRKMKQMDSPSVLMRRIWELVMLLLGHANLALVDSRFKAWRNIQDLITLELYHDDDESIFSKLAKYDPTTYRERIQVDKFARARTLLQSIPLEELSTSMLACRYLYEWCIQCITLQQIVETLDL
jgi:uncharacterized protein (DUF952 family)